MQINNNSKTVASSSKDKYSNQKYSQNNVYTNHKNDIKPQTYSNHKVNVPSDNTSKVKNKVADTTKIVKSLIAVVSTLLIAVVGISTLTTNIKATFDWIEIYDTAIYYEVSLTDFDENVKGCYVNLYNDFTNRTFDITDIHSKGYFENLQPNMHYTLAVKIGNSIILEKKVFTKFNGKQQRQHPDYQGNQDFNQKDNEKPFEDDYSNNRPDDNQNLTYQDENNSNDNEGNNNTSNNSTYGGN